MCLAVDDSLASGILRDAPEVLSFFILYPSPPDLEVEIHSNVGLPHLLGVEEVDSSLGDVRGVD